MKLPLKLEVLGWGAPYTIDDVDDDDNNIISVLTSNAHGMSLLHSHSLK